MDITEPDLLGTCTKTCDKTKGLVRTNFRGCEEVRDCYRHRKGWTRGFVRCDYCKCTCINRKYASKYTLENVEYDMSAVALEEGPPTALTQTIIENAGDTEQLGKRVLTFATTKTTTMEMSHSLQVGLTVTVGATAGVPNVASVSTSVSTSITYGFTYTAGSSEAKSVTDSLWAEIAVPPIRQ
ncbi:uncharacterized protein [Amphiura filiformis]|uniref:uncharacterized protein n=1 Tax=Amphiura filiformis TaxID=82378 RepID=UPI003B222E93